jgi:spore coat protein JB
MFESQSVNSSGYSATSVEKESMDAGTRMDKNKMMQQIYAHGLVLVETVLYLDTHPDDAEAISYFSEMKEHYNKMVKMYSEYYGPLNFDHMANENYWMWVATPMPWELEDH